MESPRNGPLMGILLAMLVVVSLVPAGVAAQPTDQRVEQPTGQSATLQQNASSDQPDPADEIYVRENGDAVLVYDSDEEPTTSQSTGQFGVDISSNLAYLLVTEPTTGQTDATGEATLSLANDELTGDGTLSVAKPPTLAEFSMELAGESTAENAESSLTMDAVADTSGTGANQLFNSVTTSGTMTTTSSQFTADGSLTADLVPSPMTGGSQASEFSFALTESDGGYTVDVDRNETVYSFGVSEWDTREKALQTLEDQYAVSAEDLDGTADVTLNDYSYTNVSDNQYRLDIDYTVEYAGLKAQLAEAIAANLTDSPQYDLTEAEANDLASRIENLTINDVSASYSVQPEAVNAEFNADIDNYDQATLAFLDLAQATETEGMNTASLQSFDRARKQLAAQQAADLTQEYTWNGEVSKPSSTEVSISFDADYTTENWQAYVEELSERGIDLPETEYEFTGTTEGEELAFDGQLSVQGNLFDQTLNYLANASEDDPEASQVTTAFLQANLQKGKLTASVNESQVVIEGGAQFEDLAALRDALAESEPGFPAGMTSAVGESENGATKTYVKVSGAVSSGAAESDVRALAYVDSDTTVHMPGDWDREFPSVDTDAARNYLGLESEDGDTVGNASNNATGNQTTTSGIGPGFGVGLSVLALLASAALLARRD